MIPTIIYYDSDYDLVVVEVLVINISIIIILLLTLNVIFEVYIVVPLSIIIDSDNIIVY